VLTDGYNWTFYLIKILACINPRSPQDQVRIGWIFWVSTSFCITSYSLAVLTLMCGGFIPKFPDECDGFEKGTNFTHIRRGELLVAKVGGISEGNHIPVRTIAGIKTRKWTYSTL
jgi:hypothetical protein